jgi:ABC-2 type transport system permease protein
MTVTAPTTRSPVAEPVLDESVLRASLTGGPRSAKPGALAASLSFGWRAMLKIKHVPMQLFDVTAFPIMFVLLFTYVFGGALGGSPSEYIQYLIPGILVQTVIMITMYTGMGLRTDISKGIFDRFRSLPIWRPAVLVGMLLADSARYAAASVVIVVLGVVLGFRPQGGPAGVVAAILLVLLFAFAFSWMWTALAFKMQTPDAVMQLAMTIMFPLVFTSNIFVSIDTMPGWLQSVVNVNPITHLVSAARGFIHGSFDGTGVLWSLVWSAAFVVVFAPLTMRFFAREE